MGIDKATLPHAGSTFLAHAIVRLEKVCDSVAVSGQTKATHNVSVIDDPLKYQGPATGIAASLRFAQEHRFDACLITPVDTPALTDQDLMQLCDAWNRYRFLARAVIGLERGPSGDHPLIMQATINREADQAVSLLTAHFHQTADRCRQALRQFAEGKSATHQNRKVADAAK